MIFAWTDRIEQEEVLCGEDLQKRFEAAVAQAESHMRAGNDPGVVVGGDLIPALVGLVACGEPERHRRLPADQQTEGQEHSAAQNRYRCIILGLWAAKGVSGSRQFWRSSIALLP